MREKLKIKKIKNLDHIEKMTNWMYNWWAKDEGFTFEQVKMYMSHSINKKKLPKTFGLFLNKELIGIYQFTNEDLFVRPDIYPWLANVHIDEKYRGNGYGGIMLSTIKKMAKKELDSNYLYLFTTHNGLYEKYGFEFVEEQETFLKPNIQRLYRLKL